jgi:hypothetical protein
MSLFKHLTHYTLAGCLLSAAANVIAAPVAFTQSEYTTFASTDMGADTSGLLSKSSPPDMLPLLSSAMLADAGNSSLATGSANTGQFDVNTDTVSSNLFAASTAGAGFSGMFAGTGQRVDFVIDYSTSDDVFGGSADSQLSVTLDSNGGRLFNGTFSSTQLIQQGFTLPSGSNNLFDIQLVSNAVADGSLGNVILGSNVASVTFSLNAAPVPEPSVAWLMLGGLGVVGLARRRTMRTAQMTSANC